VNWITSDFCVFNCRSLWNSQECSLAVYRLSWADWPSLSFHYFTVSSVYWWWVRSNDWNNADSDAMYSEKSSGPSDDPYGTLVSTVDNRVVYNKYPMSNPDDDFDLCLQHWWCRGRIIRPCIFGCSRTHLEQSLTSCRMSTSRQFLSRTLKILSWRIISTNWALYCVIFFLCIKTWKFVQTICLVNATRF